MIKLLITLFIYKLVISAMEKCPRVKQNNFYFLCVRHNLSFAPFISSLIINIYSIDLLK